MSHSDDYLFSGGRPNPDRTGVLLRFSGSGSEPDVQRIEDAAAILGRPVKYVDGKGYEQEIIAATAFGATGELAYVACASKDLGNFVAVSFEFRVRDANGREVSSEIESYNPYYGCDVHFMEWSDGVAILVYREKHDTYVAVCRSGETARYVKIADYWVMNGDLLGYWRYKETKVRRLRLPGLTDCPSISESEAKDLGICPPRHW